MVNAHRCCPCDHRKLRLVRIECVVRRAHDRRVSGKLNFDVLRAWPDDVAGDACVLRLGVLENRPVHRANETELIAVQFER